MGAAETSLTGKTSERAIERAVEGEHRIDSMSLIGRLVAGPSATTAKRVGGAT
ncbi:hypothetical protein MGAST_19510 [Mycobacterium gastri 'Wayne']|nr:hypothetical protein MGAST_19510 [Mycobacterium gastri 'Wayne']